MSVRLISAGSLLAAAALVAPAAAQATTLDFSYSGFVATVSWTQSSTPVVDTSSSGESTTVEVSNVSAAIMGSPDPTTSTQIVFYSSTNSTQVGGFSTGDLWYNDTGSGVQIYGGTEADPIFSTGSYTLSDGTLTVTAAVPEPAAWAMMVVGVPGAGAALRSAARRDVSLKSMA